MNNFKIDKIINESINNLLLEEFGIIYGLEPFCDYILERFFVNIVKKCLNEPEYNDDLSLIIDMGWAKRKIPCNNWYGIDQLKYIILKTTYDNSDVQAFVTFNENNLTAATIVINVRIGYNKNELIQNISRYGEEKMKKIFYTMYKESIMHELVHLIEWVKLKTNYKFPVYTDVDNNEDAEDIAFAFSKTEINARVTTLYYSILSSSSLRDTILNWNGKKGELCKYIINKTKDLNCTEKMERYISMLRNGLNNSDEEVLNFFEEFLKYYKKSVNRGNKNIFKINSNSNYNIMNLIKMYNSMYNTYYTYLKKLYKAADLAIDKIKMV